MEERLGYYSDSGSEYDTDSMPGRRSQRCLNCDKGHFDHYGWACDQRNESKHFDFLHWDERYMTASMRESRGIPLKGKFAYKASSMTPEPTKVDMSDWKVWARVKPGNCACDIPQHQCKYHGNARV